jgi:murein DD-endopeptidase MepM/ murein hydrolase activator NlpD
MDNVNGPLKGKFKVTQVFKGASHKGIDMVGIGSKNIYATADGTVEAARWDTKYSSNEIDTKYGMGQYVRIKSDDDGNYYYFAHMSKLMVIAGHKVKKGDIIGIEGSTGHSTGSHVHYEIRKSVSNETFLNVSQLSGIPNELGSYTQEDNSADRELEEAVKAIQQKAGLSDITMSYLEAYKYGKELILKLASAMQ